MEKTYLLWTVLSWLKIICGILLFILFCVAIDKFTRKSPIKNEEIIVNKKGKKKILVWSLIIITLIFGFFLCDLEQYLVNNVDKKENIPILLEMEEESGALVSLLEMTFSKSETKVYYDRTVDKKWYYSGGMAWGRNTRNTYEISEEKLKDIQQKLQQMSLKKIEQRQEISDNSEKISVFARDLDDFGKERACEGPCYKIKWYDEFGNMIDSFRLYDTNIPFE